MCVFNIRMGITMCVCVYTIWVCEDGGWVGGLVDGVMDGWMSGWMG
mgnify:CR=1 FL=1